MSLASAARPCCSSRAQRGSAARCSAGDRAPAPSPLLRRDALSGSLRLAAALVLPPLRADAVQGLVPGRIPGLSKEPDADGFRLYTRPEGKSGGHGVGWSEIPQYSFRVAQGWDEVPVSIADLGGAEVDLRFQSKEEGDISVVVAPVARFADIGFNASVRLEQLVTPEQLISGFAPELTGLPLQEDGVLSTSKPTRGSLLYYQYELKTANAKLPHVLVAATAYKNRLYIFSASATARQWRRSEQALRAMQDSFRVVAA